MFLRFHSGNVLTWRHCASASQPRTNRFVPFPNWCDERCNNVRYVSAPVVPLNLAHLGRPRLVAKYVGDPKQKIIIAAVPVLDRLKDGHPRFDVLRDGSDTIECENAAFHDLTPAGASNHRTISTGQFA